MKRFAFIALHATCWPVQQQCQLLGVSASGYHAWRKRPAAWQVATQRVFSTHAGRSGQHGWRTRAVKGTRWVSNGLRGCLSASGLRALCTRSSTRPPRTTQADPQAVLAAKKLAT